jgi:hypothetical protein
MAKLICEKCGENMSADGGVMTTMVGFVSPPGHNHDDNCRFMRYVCKCGNIKTVSKRNRCPACDWVGRDECFCHDGKKLDEWPE